MSKSFNLSIAMGIVFVIIGCTEPQFNQYDKKVIFVDGKPFRIPVDAMHTPHVYSTSVKDKEKISVYRSKGLNCNVGDILWLEYSTAEEAARLHSEKGKIDAYTYIAQASQAGKANCTRPLLNQEYDFYRGKELEESANARAETNYTTVAPKTVNVNHTGYMGRKFSPYTRL